MNAIFSGTLWNHLPSFPASVGLDAAGIVEEVGAAVTDIRVGDRVYVNPWLACGQCAYCRAHEPMHCDSAAFQGYFGFSSNSRRVQEDYPYGGFSQYMTAACSRLVKLPEAVSFDWAARFGYIGTSFAALRAGGLVAGGSVAINGITGTLGVAAALLAMGMGASRIYGFGRNTEIMSRLEALAHNRIHTLPLGAEQGGHWLREKTDGLGVDLIVDCSARAASAQTTLDALEGLKRGGVAVNIGALTEKLAIDPFWLMTRRIQLKGSNWFTTGEAQLLAEMVRAGVLDLSVMETRAFPLDAVNDALEAVKARPGGFVNIVVNPDK